MKTRNEPDDPSAPSAPPELAEWHRERRLRLLVCRLPERLQGPIHWLRRPAARWVRLPAGLLLIAGSALAILPVFGLWMLPFGIVLLAEDIPPLRRWTAGKLEWIEHHRPHWMGLRPEAGTD